jgi:hypothetical protein
MVSPVVDRWLGTLLGPEGTSTHAGDAWSLVGVALEAKDDGEDSHHTERLTSWALAILDRWSRVCRYAVSDDDVSVRTLRTA